MLSVCLPLLHPPRNIMVWGGVTTNFIFYFCSHLLFFLNCCCFIFPLRALLVFQLWSGSAVLQKTRFLSNMCRVRQEVRLKTHTFGFFFVTGSEVCSKPTNTQHVDQVCLIPKVWYLQNKNIPTVLRGHKRTTRRFILHLNDFYFDRLPQIHLEQLPDVRQMIFNLMFFNFTCQYDLKNEFHTRPPPLRTTREGKLGNESVCQEQIMI